MVLNRKQRRKNLINRKKENKADSKTVKMCPFLLARMSIPIYKYQLVIILENRLIFLIILNTRQQEKYDFGVKIIIFNVTSKGYIFIRFPKIS